VGRRARLGRACDRLQPARAGARAERPDPEHPRRPAGRGSGSGDADRAYDAICMFDEHTRGAAHPDGDEPRDAFGPAAVAVEGGSPSLRTTPRVAGRAKSRSRLTPTTSLPSSTRRRCTN
jgi:hypothetical protein